MTIDLSTDDLFSSDILLHDRLQEVKDDNPVLSKFFISFPDGYEIKSRQYGIFIGTVRDTLKQQTSNGDQYIATVRVLITSKQADFKLAKTGIDLATKEILKEIKKSELAKRNPRWSESQIKYTQKLDLKHRVIDFLFDEMYTWEDVDYDERDLQLIFKDVELTIEEEE